MTGLALTAVCAALLPLAASAGPAGTPGPTAEDGRKAADGERVTDGPWEADGKSAGTSGILAGIDSAKSPGTSPKTSSETLSGTLPEPGRTHARCGPALTSPAGVEAQTCVLTEGRDTWARTYYRNSTGAALSTVLSLMGPGGRSVQTYCEADVEAADAPAACETPREKARGEAGEYAAVAEFVSSEELGDEPLLLRSGSNSPGSAGS
ncbi:hypothetical protein [Streptomyces sp. NPDC000410]|uniref:hypothetical protein n=1 Tax=Streptomyces sp. NPDC000410 TaxID=3154254 RepID=UPI00332B2C02